MGSMGGNVGPGPNMGNPNMGNPMMGSGGNYLILKITIRSSKLFIFS